MNWEAIGAIGESLGAIGVITTLVYLAIQIRQNSKTMEAQMYQARYQMSEDRSGQIAESAYLPAIYCKLETDRGPLDPEKVDELTPEEPLRLRLTEKRMLRGVDNVFHQYTLGFLPDDFMEEINDTIRLRYDLWQRIQPADTSTLRSSFSRYMKKIVDETKSHQT
jgi:hypothetical protein